MTEFKDYKTATVIWRVFFLCQFWKKVCGHFSEVKQFIGHWYNNKVQHVTKSAVGEYVTFSSCYASSCSSGKKQVQTSLIKFEQALISLDILNLNLVDLTYALYVGMRSL